MDKTTAAAAALALQYLAQRLQREDLVVPEDAVLRCKLGWIVVCATRAFVETGDVMRSLPLGVGAVIVLEQDGRCGSLPPSFCAEEAARLIDADDSRILQWLPVRPPGPHPAARPNNGWKPNRE